MKYIKQLSLITIASIALLLPQTQITYAADAPDYSGADLLKHCNSSQHEKNGGFWFGQCIGYLHGVYKGVTLYSTMKKERALCWSQADRPSLNKLRLITVRYLQENPQDLHQRAEVLALHAFKKELPCDQPQASGKYNKIISDYLAETAK